MINLHALATQHADLPEDAQKKAGEAIGGKMQDEHANFLQTLIDLLDKNEIRSDEPQSFLNMNVYDKLTQQQKDSVDLSMLNITDQIRLIENFYRSEATPNSSPHLQTMIEHLWQMKERIEKDHDVFKF